MVHFHGTTILYELLFPTADHYRGYFILRCELIQRLALFDGLNGHLRLELGVVLLSTFLHGAKLLLFKLRHLS